MSYCTLELCIVKVIVFLLMLSFIPGCCKDYPEDDPYIESITPGYGYINDRTEVIIKGHGFTKNTIVMFGENPGKDFEFISEEEIRIVTPASSVGAEAVDVKVMTPKVAVRPSGFLYENPPHVEVTGISPTEGTSVKITGEGFLEGARVTIDGNEAEDVTVESTTSITAKTPPGRVGAEKEVKVCNQNGACGEKKLFTYNTNVSGVITDSERKGLLKDVEVCIDDNCTNTNKNGYYIINNVTVGKHILTATNKGYYDYSKEITVDEDNNIFPIELDKTLPPPKP